MKHCNSHHLFIFSGEPSGDLHGSWLTRRLRKESPNTIIEGISGPKMRQEGVDGPLKMEDFEVMGFTDVIKALPKIYKNFQKILKHILERQPDGVVLIDYPGFNLWLAKALRKKGFQKKIIHYISPSVWAWGKHRIIEMEKNLDLLLTIYPFESAYFAESSLNVNYVGSPIIEYISQYHYDNEWKQKVGISDKGKLIALFPGSRKSEIDRNLPIILEAAFLLKKEDDSITFGISCFNENIQDEVIKQLMAFPDLKTSLHGIPKNYTYELMKDSCCAIAKSGTVTLELALHQCPTVVVYKLSRLNRFYAQHILKVKLPHFCIVNILAQKEVFPELIEKGLTSENLFHLTKSLLNDNPIRKSCLHSCSEIINNLGHDHASLMATQAILRTCSESSIG
jgi:lipid-A-disaccharide synthase